MTRPRAVPDEVGAWAGRRRALIGLGRVEAPGAANGARGAAGPAPGVEARASRVWGRGPRPRAGAWPRAPAPASWRGRRRRKRRAGNGEGAPRRGGGFELTGDVTFCRQSRAAARADAEERGAQAEGYERGLEHRVAALEAELAQLKADNTP